MTAHYTGSPLRAQLLRALFPLSAPRLVGALVAEACARATLPLTIACAAIGAAAEAHKAVLRITP